MLIPYQQAKQDPMKRENIPFFMLHDATRTIPVEFWTKKLDSGDELPSNIWYKSHTSSQ